MLLTDTGLGTMPSSARERQIQDLRLASRQERFMTQGVDGLVRDKTRPPKNK